MGLNYFYKAVVRIKITGLKSICNNVLYFFFPMFTAINLLYWDKFGKMSELMEEGLSGSLSIPIRTCSVDERVQQHSTGYKAFPWNFHGGPLIPSYFLEDSLPTRPNRSYLLTFLRVYHWLNLTSVWWLILVSSLKGYGVNKEKCLCWVNKVAFRKDWLRWRKWCSWAFKQ